jgi:hypothetical protein
LKAIDADGPAAAGLLRVLACYAPDGIPRQVIEGGGGGPGEDEALGLLASYSMITLTAETVSMHRLVQAVILATPDDSGTGPKPRDTALEWLNDALPPNPDRNVAAWPLLRALIPHAEAIAGRYRVGEEPAALARVLNEIALFHQSQGSYQDALRLRVTALGIVQRAYGDAQPETATGYPAESSAGSHGRQRRARLPHGCTPRRRTAPRRESAAAGVPAPDHGRPARCRPPAGRPPRTAGRSP